MSPGPRPRELSYRATVGERTFEVLIEEEASGRTVVSVRPLGGDAPAPGADAAPRAVASLVRVQGALHVLRLGSRVVSLEMVRSGDGAFEVGLPGWMPLRVEVEDGRAASRPRLRGHGGREGGPSAVRAMIPGIVRSILVEEGKHVSRDDPLLIVEAMKMQNEIRAEAEGVVSRVHVRAGQSIASGEPLLELAPLR